MSAALRPPEPITWPEGLRLHPMRDEALDAVMQVERLAYPFPWTRENFRSSLVSGYLAECLYDEGGQGPASPPMARPPGRLLGYYVAQPGVEEMHLLNLTVAPADQGRGWGRRLLQALCVRCLQHGAGKLWLEVRVSNAVARRLYDSLGFTRVGLRRGYYPAERGREDGIVMCRELTSPSGRPVR